MPRYPEQIDDGFVCEHLTNKGYSKLTNRCDQGLPTAACSFFSPRTLFFTLLLQPLAQEAEHRGFFRAQVFEGLLKGFLRAVLESFDEAAIEIGLEHRGMDIAFPANGRSVAEHTSDSGDRVFHVLFRLGLVFKNILRL